MISIRPMPSSKAVAKQQASASREDAIDGPLEYLFTSSEASIESFHLSRLNTVANLRKELHEIFEEWVEAEVQARLAQWLLARKNPDNAAGRTSLAMDLEDRRSFRSGAASSTACSATRSATVDSDGHPAIAHLVARDPSGADAEDSSTRRNVRDSAARPATALMAARPRDPVSGVVPAKPRSRSPITRSAIACRSPHFPAFVHSSAVREPTTISKPGKATSMLLSFRRPHRKRVAS